MLSCIPLLATLALSAVASSVTAFIAPISKSTHIALKKHDADCIKRPETSLFADTRRTWIRSIATPIASLLPLLINDNASAASASKGCDPSDVICRQKAYDAYVDKFQEVKDTPPGRPIPAVTNRITYVGQMIIDTGAQRDNDVGYIRFGLYGDDCPASVKQMLYFLTKGIKSMDTEILENRLEIEYMPVSLGDGNGSIQNVCPGRGVDFGVPSQAKAFAESRGMRAAGPSFVPQNRPTPTLEGEAYPRPHSCAGLLSIPAKGIGYSSSSSGSSSDLDEIYATAFTITADAAPAFDKNSGEKQRVIGQIIDDESMQFLERMVNLPVQKKLGKSGSGPPLLKVRVRDVDIQKVVQ